MLWKVWKPLDQHDCLVTMRSAMATSLFSQFSWMLNSRQTLKCTGEVHIGRCFTCQRVCISVQIDTALLHSIDLFSEARDLFILCCSSVSLIGLFPTFKRRSSRPISMHLALQHNRLAPLCCFSSPPVWALLYSDCKRLTPSQNQAFTLSTAANN